jgi:hypothetical protein
MTPKQLEELATEIRTAWNPNGYYEPALESILVRYITPSDEVFPLMWDFIKTLATERMYPDENGSPMLDGAPWSEYQSLAAYLLRSLPTDHPALGRLPSAAAGEPPPPAASAP